MGKSNIQRVTHGGEVMNITGISAVVPQTSDNQFVNQVSTSVLADTLDIQEQMGDSMTKMMEQSVLPSVGSNLDIQA